LSPADCMPLRVPSIMAKRSSHSEKPFYVDSSSYKGFRDRTLPCLSEGELVPPNPNYHRRPGDMLNHALNRPVCIGWFESRTKNNLKRPKLRMFA
jgi:hypothetical protein